MIPSVNELLLLLVLIVAIGVAKRIFGSDTAKMAEDLKNRAQGKAPADSESDTKALKQNPDTGVYEPDDQGS